MGAADRSGLPCELRTIAERLTPDQLRAWLYLGRLYGREGESGVQREIERLEREFAEHLDVDGPLPIVPVQGTRQ